MRTKLGFLVLVTGLLLAALPAWAQKPLSESNIRSGAPAMPKPNMHSEPPPAAVPGARARPDSVTPADKGTLDMPPTEALFDAINRGDILSARDALSRGADLDGTNLLGLTPLELSVDLGRNDISFLLLSMRGPGAGSNSGRAPPTEAQRAPSAAERRKAQMEARQQAQAEARQARTASAQIQGSPAGTDAPQVPQRDRPPLFAGNGGAAVPSAGFLGFDPHR